MQVFWGEPRHLSVMRPEQTKGSAFALLDQCFLGGLASASGMDQVSLVRSRNSCPDILYRSVSFETFQPFP